MRIEYDYYDPMGSLEQNLVEALDVGVQQSVNQALVKAIEPLKRHLCVYAEQQGWLPPRAAHSEVVHFSTPTPAKCPPPGPHAAEFAKLADSLIQEHDYGHSGQVPPSSHSQDDASSLESKQGDTQSVGKRKRKSKNVKPTPPKLLTFDPN